MSLTTKEGEKFDLYLTCEKEDFKEVVKEALEASFTLPPNWEKKLAPLPLFLEEDSYEKQLHKTRGSPGSSIKIPYFFYRDYLRVKYKKEKFLELYGEWEEKRWEIGELSGKEILQRLEKEANYYAYKENFREDSSPEIRLILEKSGRLIVAIRTKKGGFARPCKSVALNYLDRVLEEELPEKPPQKPQKRKELKELLKASPEEAFKWWFRETPKERFIYFPYEEKLWGEEGSEEGAPLLSKKELINLENFQTEKAEKEFIPPLENVKVILDEIGIKPKVREHIISIGLKRAQKVPLDAKERQYLSRFQKRYGPAYRTYKWRANQSLPS